jgi:hypothetical protein
MKFEVLRVLKIRILVFWIMTLCSLEGNYYVSEKPIVTSNLKMEVIIPPEQ